MRLILALLCVAAAATETQAPPLTLPPGGWVRSVAVTFPKGPPLAVVNASRTRAHTPTAGADFIIRDETKTSVTFRGYWRK